MHTIDSTPEFVMEVYAAFARRLDVARRRLGRPFTYAEKILLGHLVDPEGQELRPGESYLMLQPDRVAMQDATAQMALLQLMLSGRDRVAVPTTVHCDHLIAAKMGAKEDTAVAQEENREVYEFLRSVSSKFGIGFWEPGSGIIHQVILENYAFPGGLMIGTDSHTPNAGGLGMIAAGVGGADAVDVMAGFPWEVRYPKVIGVRLLGELQGWTSPKDVILYLCGVLTVKGGTNRIIEYFGPGASTISCTGKGTITNMGAELGATGSVFSFDAPMDRYLRATGRAALADLAGRNASLVKADPEVENNPEKFFERVITIDLSTLEPHVVGPHTPDLARPISKLASDVRSNGYPDKVSASLVGSCTNSSYEDITRAADVAEQAIAQGFHLTAPLLVSPGSEQVRSTIARDGQLASLEKLGGTVLANACGPCIGQWKRTDVGKGEKNSIVTSFNRNFPKRNDGNPETMAFIASPEIVVALAIGGRLSFDPLRDTIPTADHRQVRLSPPRKAPDIPPKGFSGGRAGYVAPSEHPEKIEISIAPDSERLQELTPFPAWDGKDIEKLPILLKAKGKCTTDHISPAGPWLRYRGHLDRISDNMFLGAVNAFTGETGHGRDPIGGRPGVPFSQIARGYKAQGLRWVVVGDENYGEGSSREHAAMSPRHLGCAAVIVRSFARIHESNLKKQGILPLIFDDPNDYDRVREGDRVTIANVKDLAPGRAVEVLLHHEDGSVETIRLSHTLNGEQIGWFRAGGALNQLRMRGRAT
jgi:aconitate hydratase